MLSLETLYVKIKGLVVPEFNSKGGIEKPPSKFTESNALPIYAANVLTIAHRAAPFQSMIAEELHRRSERAKVVARAARAENRNR